MNAWHAQPLHLAEYQAGTASSTLVDSVEAHLLRCAACRAELGRNVTASEQSASERRWEAISGALDGDGSTALVRLGAATRPLAAAYGTAALLLLVVPLLAALTGSERMPTLLLAAAPLAPMVAVVVAYRRDVDPAGELSLATPISGIRLVARRALLVAAAAVPVGVVVALTVGADLTVALGWLLPGAALAAIVLAIGTTRIDPGVVAAGLGSTWALAVGVAARRGSAPFAVDLVTAPATQYACLVVALAAVAVAVVRRDRLSYRRF